MVCFKITNGRVTRKFKIAQGTTFDSLKKKITSLFPESLKDKQDDFHLHYTDKDGDCITISTDSEFQELLSELPEDAIWKLHISDLTDEHRFPDEDEKDECPVEYHQQPTSGFSFHPSYIPSRMRRPRLDLVPWGPSDPFFTDLPFHHFHRPDFHSIDREFEKMLDEHTQLLDSIHNAPVSTKKDIGEGNSSAGQELQPKMLHELAAKYPGAQIKNFGSWEPKEFTIPHGKGRVIGPVGYYVSWDYSEKKKERKKGGAKKMPS